MITVEDLPLAGAKIFTLKRFGDNRGWFTETYRQSWMDQYLPATRFVFECTSFSANRNTIRGLHAQNAVQPQAKLVGVLNGDVIDVIVDARVNSPTYGQHCAIHLSAAEPRLVFVPRGFYHGFVTLTDNVYLQYKLDNVYNPDAEVGVMYNDPSLAIAWPNSDLAPTLSQRDTGHPDWNQAYKFTGL